MRQRTTSGAGRFSKRLVGKRIGPRVLKDGSEPESTIQARILCWLGTTSLMHWRQNSGKIFVKGRMLNLGPDGISDIVIVVPPTGRILFMEVKSAKGTLRKAQKEFASRAKSSGAYYCVVRSLADAKKELSQCL